MRKLWELFNEWLERSMANFIVALCMGIAASLILVALALKHFGLFAPYSENQEAAPSGPVVLERRGGMIVMHDPTVLAYSDSGHYFVTRKGGKYQLLFDYKGWMSNPLLLEEFEDAWSALSRMRELDLKFLEHKPEAIPDISSEPPPA